MPNKRKDFTVNGKIREVRLMKNMTQQEFADAVEEDINYIKAIETKRFTPSLGLITKVHNMFKVSYEYLLEK